MSERRDVLVIGAGVIGASTAYYLARAGRRVLVLEADEPCAGASAASFAWVNAVRKEPEVYHRLNADGMAAYAPLATEVGADVGYRDGGSLEWAEDAEAERELEARLARLAHRGYRAEWLSPEAARGLEAGLAIAPRVERVAFFGADGWVDAPRLVQVLLERARGMGAEIRMRTRVGGLRARGQRVEAAITDHGEVAVERVLVAVGLATGALLAPLGVRLPLDRVPGLLALTSPPAEPLRRVVHAPGIHLRPDPTGGLLLGAPDIDRLVGEATAAGPPPEVALPLLERAGRVFPPARGTRLVAVRIGVRPMPADGVTIAGLLPGFVNAWVVVTHSGITLGPLLGRLITGEIVGGLPSPRLTPFRPQRFAPARR